MSNCHTPEFKGTRTVPGSNIASHFKHAFGGQLNTPYPISNRSSSQELSQKEKDEKITERENICLICIQHALGTTAQMIKFIKEEKFKIKHIYFLDKLYSTNDGVLEEIKTIVGKSNVVKLKAPTYPTEYAQNLIGHEETLFAKAISDLKTYNPSKIIILNDGGRLPPNGLRDLLAIRDKNNKPLPVYIIEQTTFGERELTSNLPLVPWMSLAGEKIKREEDPYIGELACNRVSTILAQLPNQSPKVGIFGLGNVGKEVAKHLVSKEFNVSYFDTIDKSKEAKKIGKIIKCKTSIKLIQDCNVMIGCTGFDTFKDISNDEIVQAINEDKWFISASSECEEWKSIMDRYCAAWINKDEYKENPYADLKYTINGHTITILYAGYPATFDHNERHAVDPHAIAITRDGLIGCLYQLAERNVDEADLNRQPHREKIPLNEDMQNNIIEKWHAYIDQKSSEKGEQKSGKISTSEQQDSSDSDKAPDQGIQAKQCLKRKFVPDFFQDKYNPSPKKIKNNASEVENNAEYSSRQYLPDKLSTISEEPEEEEQAKPSTTNRI